MNRLIIVILVISILGNLIGLYALYKYFATKRSIGYVRSDLIKANQTIGDLTNLLDRRFPHKLIFLHHSVGRGILYEGGLRDSLLEIGILVKGATYGDQIGQDTDINHWLPKFSSDMDKILTFRAHPNMYYSGDQQNDIVMFKSCFPNSDIVDGGDQPGDQAASKKTLQNYIATFEGLKEEMANHPDRLFIYITAPPLVPERSNPENAARAREFNTWLVSEYLPAYTETTKLQNFVIFDLFDLIAGRDNFLKPEYRRGEPGDAHPNKDANRFVATKFMEFFKPVWLRWQEKPDTT